MIKVCIDPGHGGSDPGAVNKKYYEKDATLQIANKLGRLLTEKGYLVRFTRNEDEFLELSERTGISNKFDAELFISIHLNAALSSTAKGIETWRYENVGQKTKNVAESVQKQLIAVTGAKNREVRLTKSLYVLKKTQASAILIECGFISNNEECKKLFDSEYQDKIVQGIVLGVEKVFPTK